MSFDAIIVGSGATGSWAAKLLTEGGLTVALLEAGTLLHADAAATGARQGIQSQCYAFNTDTRHLFVDDVDNPYETPAASPFVWIRARHLGGRTVLWHGVVLRMSDRQFKAASLDGFGNDWPISYADLKPYYDAAERFLEVRGIPGNIEEIPDGLFWPTTLSESARGFKEAVESEWPDRHVTALRRATISPCADVRYPACSAGAALSAAAATRRLNLRTHSVVRSVISKNNGRRALGVEYVDAQSGAAHEVHGRFILLCASTIETTRIMLNSTSASHPHGIGNCNGILGRYLTEHVFGVRVTGLRGGRCSGASDFYIPNFRNRSGAGGRFLRGYGIQGYFKPGPGDTTECTLVCCGEMLPRAVNTVTLGRMRDKWGIPVPCLTCHASDNELEMARDQALEAARLLRRTGFDVTDVADMSPPGLSMHEGGTARMGLDPTTSILNGYGRCWNVPNLFVTDGASFPSVGFQNPTLTMMALTGRACACILRES